MASKRSLSKWEQRIQSLLCTCSPAEILNDYFFSRTTRRERQPFLLAICGHNGDYADDKETITKIVKFLVHKGAKPRLCKDIYNSVLEEYGGDPFWDELLSKGILE